MMEIRQARVEDCQAFWEHSRIHFAESGRDGDLIFNPFEKPWDVPLEKYMPRQIEEWNKPVFEDGWTRSWIITDGEKVFGDLSLKQVVRSETAKHRALLMMGMQRSVRGKGYGSQLLSTAIEWAREQGIDWLQLFVFENNKPAQALYKKFGFVETGRMPDMFRIHGQNIGDISMVLKLK